MHGCISNLCPVSSADSTMKRGLGSALSAVLGCLRKKGAFTYYRAASSGSILSYKFTSQTLTRAGVSCVCSLGSCLFGKQEVLQCQGEGWLHRLPGREPARQSSWSEVSLLRNCLLEVISLLSPALKGMNPCKELPSCLSMSQFCFPCLCQLAFSLPSASLATLPANNFCH